jgi:two-component system, OmpR family, sensor histidine kinase ChvG
LLDELRKTEARRGEAAPSATPLHRPSRLRGRLMLALRRTTRWISRRLASSLTRRIVLLNILGLVAMLLAFLWLNQTRQSVIDARVQSMLTQSAIMSAAIAASATVETDSLTIDPDKLLALQAGETLSPDIDPESALEFSINPEKVAPVLRRLILPTTLRARVFDRGGDLLIDTRTFFGRSESRKSTLPAPQESATVFQRTWNSIRRSFGRTAIPATDGVVTGKFPEVERALKGEQGTIIRVNTDGDTIIYVATPIDRLRTTRGVLLLSTLEGDIDEVIGDERIAIFFVFLIAASVMLVLSMLLAGTIAEPVRRLSDAAERVRRGIKARQEIPDLTYRADEIGHLSGSLRDMTKAMYGRIEAIESFAADVAHELKNPLTSLRSAVETLPLARNEESRGRLLAVIQHDVQRLDRLISDISDASRLDAELARADAEPVDMRKLLETLVSIQNDIPHPNNARTELAIGPVSAPRSGGKGAKGTPNPFIVHGRDSRFGQVMTNLMDNACSFSPQDGIVEVRLSRDEGDVVVTVDDAGPGIPDHAIERVFERFYTDRPEQGFGQHSGLGLSITRQIVEAHHGKITAGNRFGPSGEILGARFTVRLPAAHAG